MASRESATHWASLAAEHAEAKCPGRTKEAPGEPAQASQPACPLWRQPLSRSRSRVRNALQNVLLEPAVEEETRVMQRMQKIITLAFEEATAYSRGQTKLQFSKIPRN